MRLEKVHASQGPTGVELLMTLLLYVLQGPYMEDLRIEYPSENADVASVFIIWK